MAVKNDLPGYCRMTICSIFNRNGKSACEKCIHNENIPVIIDEKKEKKS